MRFFAHLSTSNTCIFVRSQFCVHLSDKYIMHSDHLDHMKRAIIWNGIAGAPRNGGGVGGVFHYGPAGHGRSNYITKFAMLHTENNMANGWCHCAVVAAKYIYIGREHRTTCASSFLVKLCLIWAAPDEHGLRCVQLWMAAAKMSICMINYAVV